MPNWLRNVEQPSILSVSCSLSWPLSLHRFNMSLKNNVPQRAAASSHMLQRHATLPALRRVIDLGVARTELWFAFRCISARRSVTMDILWDLVQKTLSLLEPSPQGFHEAFVPLTAFELRRHLRILW